MSFSYNTIEEAVADLRAGKIILVSDDEDRENEGDMICAAEFATGENVNMMASHAKGLICMPMSQSLALKLGLYPMVAENTDNQKRLLLFPLTMFRLRQEFRPLSVQLRLKNASMTLPWLRISAGPVTCSPLSQKKAACWSEMVTLRQRWICAGLRA